jgi:hypothetical protein
MNPWDDDPDYPPGDWQAEVANGDTRLGYVEWVAQQRDLQCPHCDRNPCACLESLGL